jgi:hypothetical protein
MGALASAGLLLAAGCNNCPHKSWWYVLDSSAHCLEPSDVSQCNADDGTPDFKCSVGKDGRFYLSLEDRLVPDGRECTDAEAAPILVSPPCNADAGDFGDLDAG